MQAHKLSTLSIHAGEAHLGGALPTPIYQSSTFLNDGTGDYDDIVYMRLSNTPNHVNLHQKLAALENTEAALVAASGMAAITTTLLTVLSAGDHLVAQDCLYGGTHSFVREMLPRLGIETTFISHHAPEAWADAFRDNTRAVYFESVTNPLLGVIDIPRLVGLAQEKGVPTIIDNTFLSPVHYQPATDGVDLILHSGTKYLNGHSDIVCGTVAGSAETIQRIRHTQGLLGGSLDTNSCFLLSRGLKTLSCRVVTQTQSAQAIAEFLEKHAKVHSLAYPGLPSHPDHERAARQYRGFGAMLSFAIDGTVAQADAVLSRLKLFAVAPSLGGVESLITRPALTSHAGVPPAERQAMGISDTLIRLSTGLEATEDLLADLEQALASL